MRKPLAAIACVVGVAGACALWFAGRNAVEVVRPVPPTSDIVRRAGAVAAREALGRRVVVLSADPGKPGASEVLESGLAPEGWALFPAVPPGSGAFGAGLHELAEAAGAAWARDRALPDDLRAALALFAVKALVVDDAGKGAPPVRVFEQAEPVLRIGGAGDLPASVGAISLASALAATPARESDGWTWSDWDDTLWGGSVTVTTERPGRFVLPHPAAGGRVTVNGAEATRLAAGPLLVLALPAGTSQVEVRFIEPRGGETVAVAGAAGIVVSLLALILAFRPSRAAVAAEAERRAEESRAPEASRDPDAPR